MSTLNQSQTSSEAYNEVPYPGGAFRNTHPSHLGMVAHLLNLHPPTPKNCRVLELGCSMGSNLIPMAAGLPDSEFVGIDFSERQIGMAQKVVDEMQLSNIRFETKSILDVEDEFGTFDYIICHGVYSWVASDVQDKILQIGNQNLSENGVMLVSYNTYPGWHFRRVVREMMRYHVEHIADPAQKVVQARNLLKFLQDHSKSKFEAYATLLKEEAEMLSKSDNSYLFHEHLEEVNEPLYFHEFVRRVDQAGMRYLADAAIQTMVAQRFDDQAAEILRNAPLLRREQYMDFLRNRMFRNSLICHQGQSPDYQIDSSNLLGLHVGLLSGLKKVSEDGDNVVWENPSGRMTTEFPLTSIFRNMNDAFPRLTRVDDLLSEITDNQVRRSALEALLIGFVRGMFVLSLDPEDFVCEVSETPRASAYARYQARNKAQKITNRLHSDCMLQPQQRFLIEHLDGSRTIDDVATLLHDECASGRFKVSKEGQDLAPDLEQLKQICSEEVTRLSRFALFDA